MSDCGGHDHCQRDELLARVEAAERDRDALRNALEIEATRREALEVVLAKHELRRAGALVHGFMTEGACPECGTVMPLCKHVLAARAALAGREPK